MTTSQTYQADGHQPEPDQHHAVPEETLTGPEADLAEPDADQAGDGSNASNPANVVVPEDLQPATSAAPDNRGLLLRSGAAQEPGMPDTSPASPSPGTVHYIAPASIADSRSASESPRADGHWSEIRAMFVDDPRASTELAAGLVDDRVADLIQAFRERQHSLQSAWQADNAGTEELRIALQRYRAFWNRLEDLPPQA